MGGCCCCSSRRSHLNAAPVYYYCPRTSEEREPLSSHHGAASTLSSGLLVHTNLETSTPDTYRAPPAPLPYDMDLGRPQTPPVTQGGSADKSEDALQTTDTEAVRETISGSGFETSDMCENLKESGCKIEKNSALASAKESEVELSKLNEPIVSAAEEEDVCPTCFEEYDEENPRIITKCEHHFHLSCILEWMERSDTCPVCDQLMVFNQ
ncbi:probable E3 ubiquitin-protein ligase RHB1A [Macadamia integrifolia]|uniref:probable E3 ubiquitin-protein ligase RHB1A n=1 Tax=Macadamia integrifolia TaxID=60698 RepID=UPI001C52E604|nr:probable E3 ubiquitin-protein ligase RHB1A [Macadamia integrifolia]XP_042477272.1 probable E3 ubiquitin-protein ligase RHB1A [Macadamia integrifolia]XP_042477273.1 probable E3 ubiquitin-protein ligase RHB1A [Macadamia integrifolia]XP_042477274.1 probable E3 ubiquitin-protein ligase RHB1A [Macadamia integrifolia]XP_042477275.1 probable E3 ubiquitin-protein ligase RHB1A [Macadamia integrifolia]XP_042477276.1 probable E3 ubiquitin-protein ligase RHB1A [Macadamia integrifolia]XP_042477277.1 pr